MIARSLTQPTAITLGQWFFRRRDYTPIPLIILMLLFADPTVPSSTVGTALIILGELLRIYSVAFIGSISRTRKDQAGDNLISSGPFSIVRNPLYVANFLICLGFAIFSGVFWLVLLTVVLFAFQYHLIVRYEEQILLGIFQDQYRHYRETVPAWWPRRLPRMDTLDWPPTFSPALRSERRTLTSIAILLSILALFY